MYDIITPTTIADAVYMPDGRTLAQFLYDEGLDIPEPEEPPVTPPEEPPIPPKGTPLEYWTWEEISYASTNLIKKNGWNAIQVADELGLNIGDL